MVKQGKKATHICSRVEGDLSGPSKFQGPVSEPNSVGCNRQLNIGSLHKQTRRNSLSRDMHSPVENHVDLFATHLNYTLPLYMPPVPDPYAWDIDALNINCLCYLLTALLHKVILKIRQCYCLIIVIAPGWPGMPWIWDLVQLSTEISLLLPESTTLLKLSNNYVFQSNPQHLNLHTWCLGVDSSQTKAFLWMWQRELLHLKGHQQGPSISQS